MVMNGIAIYLGLNNQFIHIGFNQYVYVGYLMGLISKGKHMLNLTPHSIHIHTNDGVIAIPPSGTIARVEVENVIVGNHTVEGIEIPVITRKTGVVSGLPKDMKTPFLVSGMVLDSLGSEYHGVAFSPDTGASCIRDEKGRIVGVTQLVTVAV